jgi:hypothetical protein
MSSRPALAQISASAANSRTSLGPARGVPRKSTAPTNAGANSSGSQISSSSANRKSLGGKDDQNKTNGTDTGRSMIPTGPSSSRPSLAAQSRMGIPRQSLSSRPSISTNRRNSRGSLNPANGRYDAFFFSFFFFQGHFHASFNKFPNSTMINCLLMT